MALKKLFVFASLFSLIFFNSCGSPNEPVNFMENDGGYQIKTVFATYGDANDVMVEDTLAYIAQGEGGMLIVSIKDIEKPEVVRSVTENARGYSYKLAKSDSIIYVAAGSYGVTVINVAEPGRAQVTAYNLAMKPAKGLSVSRGFLFTAISERGIKIASLSYPPEPDIRGGFSTPGYAQDLAICENGDTAFVANGEMGLAIFDLSDFSGGFGDYPQIGWIDTEGYAESVILDEENKIAYLASGTAGVYAIDYSKTDSLKITSQFDTKGYAKDLILDGDKLYVTSENGGVYFFGVSTPGKLKKLGRIETEDARGMACNDNFIFVADKERGLIIIGKN